MPVWFLVDDNLAFHKKVITAGNDAMGAWVRAGAWAAFALTDGYVPITVEARQIGTKKQLENLVKAGLWSRVTDGYQFHDLGTTYNPPLRPGETAPRSRPHPKTTAAGTRKCHAARHA